MKFLKIDPKDTGRFDDKDDALEALDKLNQKLYDLLYLMFAEGKRSLLIILHGIDTSGKDGVVRHLFSAANPQGLRVFSFKKPSDEELRHDFLWRCHRAMPEAGYAAIFNRSYYEEVTTVQVHPELLKLQRLPDEVIQDRALFDKRYEQINAFEKVMAQNGTVIMKFLLHISKPEQKLRLGERLADHTKNWKFSPQDLEERKYWTEYMEVFNRMLKHTNTKYAPWYVIPSDKKWYRNYLITKNLVDTLSGLKMHFPTAPKR